MGTPAISTREKAERVVARQEECEEVAGGRRGERTWETLHTARWLLSGCVVCLRRCLDRVGVALWVSGLSQGRGVAGRGR